MTNRSICFDKRQKATVLAALYLYRDANLDHEEAINRIATQEWEEKALVRHEIDELIMAVMEVESEVEPDSPSEAPRWLPMGEVCHGSLRMEDLFPAVLEFAQKHWDTIAHEDMNSAKIVNQCQAHWLTEFDADSELTADLYGELCGALEAVVPPFCYFGANDGNSSAIGVWVSDDAINEAIQDRKMVKVNNWLDAHNVSPTYEWVLIVGFKSGAYERLYGLVDGIRRQIWRIKPWE
jgi:hypothetical protein